jgi:hypothetical protein
MYGRLTEGAVQYLAVELLHEGKKTIQTFLDRQGFAAPWGKMERRLEDEGRFAVQEDGALRQAHRADDRRPGGAGAFAVEIGEQRFECLRVLELEGEVTDKDAPLTESFLTRQGRTVLRRHYCHDAHSHLSMDREQRIVLDGQVFVHWYDNLTDGAL